MQTLTKASALFSLLVALLALATSWPSSQVSGSPTVAISGQQTSQGDNSSWRPQESLENPMQRLQLSQSAPYALTSPQTTTPAGAESIVLHLALDQLNADKLVEAAKTPTEPWTFVGPNGTALGSRVDVNLDKLIDTLKQNNFTSQVKFDENNRGLVNITISNMKHLTSTQPIDELILGELIADAFNSKFAHDKQELAAISVLKDNHRFELKPSNRQRLPTTPTSTGLNGDSVALTPPPIRSAIEVVAANYTVRKIAEEANYFAIKLLNQLNTERLGGRNVVQASFGVYQGLALLLTGASGETAKEMDRVLLGSQSTFENSKLTHDQDRTRLLASLGDVMSQLQASSTHHFHFQQQLNGSLADVSATPGGSEDSKQTHLHAHQEQQYSGGSAEQHLIVGNNLLFSPAAYEVSEEFKVSLSSYYNHTALTRVEIGSSGSIQTVNAWIRRTTVGVVPSILNRKSTFDEFNVMTLLCTSWLAQEWADTFYRIALPFRTSVRLRGTNSKRSLGSSYTDDYSPVSTREVSLLEFVDSNKESHFVDYIQSRPTTNIHHYHTMFNGVRADVVVVPFRNSDHRFVAITPLSSSSPSQVQLPLADSPSNVAISASSNSVGSLASTNNTAGTDAPDSSPLSKLVAAFSASPRKAMRFLWNIVSPDILTKQTLKNLQLSRQRNVSADNQVSDTPTGPPLVQLSIPLMRVEADASLSAALNHIGIVNPFDPNQANFIGINGHPFNYYKLHLSDVVSKTTFNLNERGINYDRTIRTLESLRIVQGLNKQKESDSKSNVRPDRAEMVDNVKLSKPFMFLVCDIKSKLVLYTGVLRNPVQDGSP